MDVAYRYSKEEGLQVFSRRKSFGNGQTPPRCVDFRRAAQGREGIPSQMLLSFPRIGNADIKLDVLYSISILISLVTIVPILLLMKKELMFGFLKPLDTM